MKHSPGEDVGFSASGPGEHQCCGVGQFDYSLLLIVVVKHLVYLLKYVLLYSLFPSQISGSEQVQAVVGVFRL